MEKKKKEKKRERMTLPNSLCGLLAILERSQCLASLYRRQTFHSRAHFTYILIQNFQSFIHTLSFVSITSVSSPVSSYHLTGPTLDSKQLHDCSFG